MARRRKGTPPPKPFEQAFPLIDGLEQAVVHHTTDVTFTAERVARWMYPDDVVDKLRVAFPHVREMDRGAQFTDKLLLPVAFPGVYCHITIQAKELQMLCPPQGKARHDETRGAPILEALTQAYTQHLRFEKVREVVRWLNDNATAGAARHYCPWLISVLPADHPFNDASGHVYREPVRSMSEITPVMRECGAIMASALLCGEIVTGHSRIAVRFEGVRGTDNYISNPFWLL